MIEEKFVYYWSYNVTVGRRDDHQDHSHFIYTPKQIEEFQNSKLELCFEITEDVEVELKPSDIDFIKICTEKKYKENELAQKLCFFDDIIRRFQDYYNDQHC